MQKKHGASFQTLKDECIAQAMRARDWSSSYRDYHVGAVFYIWTGKQYRIVHGWNVKAEAGPTPKICAELNALHGAYSADAKLVVAIVVVGVPQKDHDSGHEGKTLHPCGSCRQMLTHSKIVEADTIVLTINAEDPTIREELTFAELLALHSGNGD